MEGRGENGWTEGGGKGEQEEERQEGGREGGSKAVYPRCMMHIHVFVDVQLCGREMQQKRLPSPCGRRKGIHRDLIPFPYMDVCSCLCLVVCCGWLFTLLCAFACVEKWQKGKCMTEHKWRMREWKVFHHYASQRYTLDNFLSPC